MTSKSKIPPEFGAALGEIGDLIADGVNAFCFHGQLLYQIQSLDYTGEPAETWGTVVVRLSSCAPGRGVKMRISGSPAKMAQWWRPEAGGMDFAKSEKCLTSIQAPG